MTWTLNRWIWQLDGPLYMGAPPAGSLNRARLHVPARALWGAVTAELARFESTNGKMPNYDAIGKEVQEQTRFTYLYPAERHEKGWRAWLPEYRDGDGLVWITGIGPRRARETQTDRRFRKRLLSARPGTAIDPSSDTAEDGSLRETECIQTRWRQNDGTVGSPVAMLGFVFTRDESIKRLLDRLEMLFLGGDTRCGLGRLRRIDWTESLNVFDKTVRLDGPEPVVESDHLLAHAGVAGIQVGKVYGQREALSGWDYGKRNVQRIADALWMPGSRVETVQAWLFKPNGHWETGTTLVEQHRG